jgi:hypothetical protein
MNQQKPHRASAEEEGSLYCSRAQSTRIRRCRLTFRKLVRLHLVRSIYLVVGVRIFSRLAGRTHPILVPDVSAIGEGPLILVGFEAIARTTALSALIFGSIITLLTNERMAAGKPGLGFLNPLIYQIQHAFTDIPGGESALPLTRYHCLDDSVLEPLQELTLQSFAPGLWGSTGQSDGTRSVYFVRSWLNL